MVVWLMLISYASTQNVSPVAVLGLQDVVQQQYCSVDSGLLASPKKHMQCAQNSAENKRSCDR